MLYVCFRWSNQKLVAQRRLGSRAVRSSLLEQSPAVSWRMSPSGIQEIRLRKMHKVNPRWMRYFNCFNHSSGALHRLNPDWIQPESMYHCCSVANLAFFPRIWACFFLNLRFFLESCGVLIFGLVLFKNCLFLGLFFANFLISGLLFWNCCVTFAVSISWKSTVYQGRLV